MMCFIALAELQMMYFIALAELHLMYFLPIWYAISGILWGVGCSVFLFGGRSKIGDCVVSVAVTPDGYADAVVEGRWFVTPLEVQMKFSELVDMLENGDEKGVTQFPKGVYYIQKQDSNFTMPEYEPLARDAEMHIAWATEAFGWLVASYIHNHQSAAVSFDV